ncbi:hypothetical protein ABIA16_000439 [Sinorhizobium fredii]
MFGITSQDGRHRGDTALLVARLLRWALTVSLRLDPTVEKTKWQERSAVLPQSLIFRRRM